MTFNKSKILTFILFILFLFILKIDFRIINELRCCQDDYDYYSHALTIAQDFDFDYSNQITSKARFYNQDLEKFLHFFFLFLCGSILMRSAGCIVNDIVDRKFDKKIERTRKRPIASGQISIQRSIFYTFVLCSLAFVILIQFNLLTIILGIRPEHISENKQKH